MRLRRKKYLPIYLMIIIILVCGSIVYSKKISKDKIKPLTMEEKLEDFEYLYNFIAENYPFLKVNERVNGLDWLGEKDKFKSDIEKTTTDLTFIGEISKIIGTLNNGHTHMLNESSFLRLHSIYSDPEHEDEFKPWFEVLDDESVLKRYEIDEKKLEEYGKQQTYYNDLPYCKTDIIVPNEVAYLKISQMNTERIEKDGIIIRDFLGEIKDYEKLIIDIRRNSGGNDLYWMKNVIEPLTNKEISTDYFIFVRDDYAKHFYEHREIGFFPVEKLEKGTLDSFPEEIKMDFKYYHLLTKKIDPVDPVGFNGKIYLLVDKYVYSSAESFAAFCKDTGFATLVGLSTGGDGIGLDPILFSLPNSKRVIRFSGILALNGDGTINDEVQITPDVKIMDATIRVYELDKPIQYIIND